MNKEKIRTGVISINSIDLDIFDELNSAKVLECLDCRETKSEETSPCEDCLGFDGTQTELIEFIYSKIGDPDNFLEFPFQKIGLKPDPDTEWSAIVNNDYGTIQIVKSKHGMRCHRCSPCYPDQGNLDSPDNEGWLCYAPPPDIFPEDSDLRKNIFIIK